jgi:membrane associated rhomboid family serine protease
MQVDVPMERLPVANWTLIVATALVSLGFLAAEHKSTNRLDLTDFPENPELERQLADPRVPQAKKQELKRQQQQAVERWLRSKRGEAVEGSPLLKYALHPDRETFHVWQLVTYEFVHGDFWHLLGNMLFLFCFGNAVNAKLGHLLYVGVYLGLGVVAGLAYVIVTDATPLVGASGAIAGVTGVFLILYPLNEIAVWTFRSMIYSGDVWRFPSWLFILFYMAWDLFGTMKLTGESGVAYVCHLGGELVGIAVGGGLVVTGYVRSERGEQNLLELWGWVPERQPRRRKKRRPKLPRANSDSDA